MEVFRNPTIGDRGGKSGGAARLPVRGSSQSVSISGRASTMRTSRTFARTLAGVGARARDDARLSAACDVFDPSLYQSRAHRSESPIAASGTSRSSARARPGSSSTPRRWPRDYHDFSGCARRDLPGNDGFVRIETAAGREVARPRRAAGGRPGPGHLPAARAATCAPARPGRPTTPAASAGPSTSRSCRAAAPTWSASTAAWPAAGRFSVIVTRPVCGNGGQLRALRGLRRRQHRLGRPLRLPLPESSCSGGSVTEKESNETALGGQRAHGARRSPPSTAGSATTAATSTCSR